MNAITKPELRLTRAEKAEVLRQMQNWVAFYLGREVVIKDDAVRPGKVRRGKVCGGCSRINHAGKV